MKKFFKYSVLLISALVLSSASLSAQGDLVLSKKVKDNLNGQYTLTLETYVTGSSIATVTTTPCDIVLVLDRSTSMWSNKLGDVTRAAALRDGVVLFLNEVYKSATIDENGQTRETPIQHRVSAVTFYGGGNGTVTENLGNSDDLSGGLKIITADGVMDSIIDQVEEKFADDAQPSANGTPALKGLSIAYNTLNNGSTNKKIVVFFTDGNCGYGQNWGTTPRETAKPTINKANDLKTELGATVYAVGTFKTADNDTKFYMNHVSSKYTSDVTQTGSWGSFQEIEAGETDGPENSNGYVFLSSSSEDLKNAFKSISSKINTESEAFPLDGTSSVVVDVLADKFVLPKDTDVSKIRLYYAPIDTDNAVTAPVKWKDEASTSSSIKIYKDANNVVIAQGSATPADPAKVDHVEYWEPIASTSDVISFSKDDDGADVVNVTGFDFSANYVGINTSASGTKSWNPDGKKLIIQFEIDVDPSHPGGVGADGDGVFTNKNTSGVYRIQRNEDGDPILDPTTGKPLLEEDPIKPYEQPKVFLPYLKIVKTGLKQGESATFKVTKVTSEAGTDVVTSDAFTATVIVTQTTDPAEDPNAYAVVKLVHQGYYKVEETSWTWAYTTSTPYQVKQILTVPVDDSTKPGKFVTYTFVNSDITGAAEHAENFVINNMSKERSLGDSKTKNATVTF